MKKNYNEILKQAIKEAGYKQKDVAEKMGDTPQNLSNYLNRNDLTIYNFVRICEAININPADIVNNENPRVEIDPEIERHYYIMIKRIMKMSQEDRIKILTAIDAVMDLIPETKE